MTKKVDTFMEIFHKVISVITVLACVAGLAWSCSTDGELPAHADDIDILTTIFAYEDDFREGLIDANRACNDAMNDSSLSDEDKAKIRAVLALQELALRTMPDIYGNPTNPILPDSDTVTISGSGASGLYTSEFDSKVHTVTLLNGGSSISSPVASSDEFSLYFSIDNIDSDSGHIDVTFSGTNANYSCVYTTPSTSTTYTITFPNSSYFTSGYSSTYNSRWETTLVSGLRLGFITGIPTLSRNLNWSNYVSKSLRLTIGGYGVSVILPEANVDTETPWDYYNDTLLPYMHNNYPDVINNYYVFPNGYHGPSVDPTEPSLPNGGINVYNDWNFNIGFNTIIATDASGQPVTDASGETVTETVIETETRPTDAVYHFQIPTLTPLDTQTATIPPYEVPSEYAGYMGDMFSAITDFIDDAGLSSIAPVFLTLAGIGLVIGVLL